MLVSSVINVITAMLSALLLSVAILSVVILSPVVLGIGKLYKPHIPA